MSNVVLLECDSCGARVSGVRTAFGSLVVPGCAGCPRCGSSELSEVERSGEATSEAEPPADGGTDRATE